MTKHTPLFVDLFSYLLRFRINGFTIWWRWWHGCCSIGNVLLLLFFYFRIYFFLVLRMFYEENYVLMDTWHERWQRKSINILKKAFRRKKWHELHERNWIEKVEKNEMNFLYICEIHVLNLVQVWCLFLVCKLKINYAKKCPQFVVFKITFIFSTRHYIRSK